MLFLRDLRASFKCHSYLKNVNGSFCSVAVCKLADLDTNFPRGVS